MVTVALAFAVFGQALTSVQDVGGALVLAAVLAVRTPARMPSLRIEEAL